MTTLADGTKIYYLLGQIHRIDGPAQIWANGTKRWIVNGRHHRIDGPAIEWDNGDKKYFIEGIETTEEEINKFITKRKELISAHMSNDVVKLVMSYL